MNLAFKASWIHKCPLYHISFRPAATDTHARHSKRRRFLCNLLRNDNTNSNRLHKPNTSFGTCSQMYRLTSYLHMFFVLQDHFLSLILQSVVHKFTLPLQFPSIKGVISLCSIPSTFCSDMALTDSMYSQIRLTFAVPLLQRTCKGLRPHDSDKTTPYKRCRTVINRI